MNATGFLVSFTIPPMSPSSIFHRSYAYPMKLICKPIPHNVVAVDAALLLQSSNQMIQIDADDTLYSLIHVVGSLCFSQVKLRFM